MAVFICGLIGWFVGDFIIGGILFALLAGPNADARTKNKGYSYVGKFIGAFIGFAIGGSLG